MKFIFINFLIIILSVLSTFAQDKHVASSEKIRFNLAISDTSNNKILKKHPTINEILIIISDNVPVIQYVHYNKYSTLDLNKEFFDLQFEGDQIYFQQKYGILKYQIPRLSSKKTKNGIDNFIDIDRVHIKMDSIIYEVTRYPTTSEETDKTPFIGLGGVAKPSFDLKAIENKLTKQYQNLIETVPGDSVLVFRAIVSENGKLQDMQQIVGDQNSRLSALIKQEFQNSKNEWEPARIRSAKESIVRIFIKINEDRTVTVKTPKILGSFSGE